MRLATLLVLFTLQGCIAVQDQPAPTLVDTSALTFPDERAYGEPPAIPSPAELLQLTREQQQHFLAWINDPLKANSARFQLVADYMESITEGFDYQGESLTASASLARKGGNCLSLALLTAALADLAGVQIGFQLMDDKPVYEFNGTVIEKGVHVRSVLYGDPLPQEPGTTFAQTRPAAKVDYFPSGDQYFLANLSYGEFVAMYYSNQAGEALANNDLNTAYWNLRASLVFAPGNSPALNMLAITSRRKGNAARAEELFRWGIEHSVEKLTLLKNYKILLDSSGRLAEAAMVERQLEQYEDPSPYHWFQLAQTSYDEGDYRHSIRYFNRALQLAPYMHQAYFGVAKAEYELGNARTAKDYLQRALDNVSRTSTRQLYKAKLAALSSSQ